MPAPDTIFAPASGAGRAAIAVIRISGPATRRALSRIAGRTFKPRHATLAKLSQDGRLLDHALVLWFPGPASFTGEDSAEFQLHGGRAVVAAVLRALAAVPGLRPAGAGESPRRAGRDGRLDLGAVEGLADLIDAQTEAQRRQALRQLEGALGHWVAGLRGDLLTALALAEGAIDFADEDQLVASFEAEISDIVTVSIDRIAAELARETQGLRLREGLVVAIAGPPNAGKSTLLNALAGREVAIVSEEAGTTRDVIAVDLDLAGYPVQLIDTAGLRDTESAVEREGIVRARARAASADLVLWLHAATEPAAPDIETHGSVWTVATKADLGGNAAADHLVSARTGVGLDALVARLTRFAAKALVDGEGAVVTRLRHRRVLEDAHRFLDRLTPSRQRQDLELVAEELRGALAALASLVGTVGTEEVLGAIFARFCIGK